MKTHLLLSFLSEKEKQKAFSLCYVIHCLSSGVGNWTRTLENSKIIKWRLLCKMRRIGKVAEMAAMYAAMISLKGGGTLSPSANLSILCSSSQKDGVWVAHVLSLSQGL